MTKQGVQLAVELSKRRMLVTERALSSLAAHADDHGLTAVLEWIEDDPGLAWLPSWQWWGLAYSLRLLDEKRVRRESEAMARRERN